MLTVAETFIQNLREGKTSEAISVVKQSLKENTTKQIEENRIEILKSYGFNIVEAKKDGDGKDNEPDPKDDNIDPDNDGDNDTKGSVDDPDKKDDQNQGD